MLVSCIICTLHQVHDFRLLHKVDENCALLGCYTLSGGDSLQMFHYHYSLCNNPEECRSVHQVFLG
jgi:hypothetical protein